jgi:hypothetical protein
VQKYLGEVWIYAICIWSNGNNVVTYSAVFFCIWRLWVLDS